MGDVIHDVIQRTGRISLAVRQRYLPQPAGIETIINSLLLIALTYINSTHSLCRVRWVRGKVHCRIWGVFDGFYVKTNLTVRLLLTASCIKNRGAGSSAGASAHPKLCSPIILLGIIHSPRLACSHGNLGAGGNMFPSHHALVISPILPPP